MMILLGIILLIVGLILGIAVMWWIGIALLVVGAVLNLVGGAPYGRGRYWY